MKPVVSGRLQYVEIAATILLVAPGVAGSAGTGLSMAAIRPSRPAQRPSTSHRPNVVLIVAHRTEMHDPSASQPAVARRMVARYGRLAAIPGVLSSISPTPGTNGETSTRIVPATSPWFVPGAVWLDTEHHPIQAHGGGILFQNGTYYWYGEDKSQGYFNKVGVSCYASSDLRAWRHMSTALPAADFPEPFRENGVCERPKVIYNPQTRQYVMWMHLDARGYSVSEAGVAVASRPDGPFHFLRHFRPIPASTFRDMNLFQDDDGRAYVFFSGDNNASLYAMRLNADATGPVEPAADGVTFVRALDHQWREAPAPFKVGGRYYLITSGTSGWAPNAARYAVAASPLGPWKLMGNPCVGPGAQTTFHSQSTFVLPVAGRTTSLVYMGDRWNPRDLSDSRYVWLPLTVTPDGRLQIRWQDQWRLH